jgi:DNA-binding beta-propeller fold protein YncE
MFMAARSLLVLLLFGLVGAGPAAAATGSWLFGEGDWVGVVVDDVAVGQVHDPQKFFDETEVRDIAINEQSATAYARLEGVFDNPIVMIDLLTLTATRKLDDPLGLVPSGVAGDGGLAVSPDGTRVFYSTDAIPPSGGVVIGDTTMNTVIAAIPIVRASQLLVSSDGLTLYVLGESCDPRLGCETPASIMNRVDVATGSVVQQVTISPNGFVGLNPAEFAITEDGSTIYMAGSPLLAIDAATLAITPIDFPPEVGPESVGVIGNTVYVLTELLGHECSGRVFTVDRTTLAVTQVLDMPGLQPTTAFGVNLDGTEILIPYVPYAYPQCTLLERPPVSHVGIFDPATNSLLGEVADPHGYIQYALSAVDPFLGRPLRTCLAGKRKAAGAEVSRELGCYGAGIAKGAPASAKCLSAAQSGYAKSFARVKGECPADAGVVDTLVNSCIASLLADVPTTGACGGKSAKAAGMGALHSLQCAASSLSKPSGLAACNAKWEPKLQDALTSSGACAAPSLLADIQSQCLTPIADLLSP